jgi:hypothetical protein
VLVNNRYKLLFFIFTQKPKTSAKLEGLIRQKL